jgi:hypothetical protein
MKVESSSRWKDNIEGDWENIFLVSNLCQETFISNLNHLAIISPSYTEGGVGEQTPGGIGLFLIFCFFCIKAKEKKKNRFSFKQTS